MQLQHIKICLFALQCNGFVCNTVSPPKLCLRVPCVFMILSCVTQVLSLLAARLRPSESTALLDLTL